MNTARTVKTAVVLFLLSNVFGALRTMASKYAIVPRSELKKKVKLVFPSLVRSEHQNPYIHLVNTGKELANCSTRFYIGKELGELFYTTHAKISPGIDTLINIPGYSNKPQILSAIATCDVSVEGFVKFYPDKVIYDAK